MVIPIRMINQRLFWSYFRTSTQPVEQLAEPENQLVLYLILELEKLFLK